MPSTRHPDQSRLGVRRAIPLGENKVLGLEEDPRGLAHENGSYTAPYASIASATLTKPAMLAPFT